MRRTKPYAAAALAVAAALSLPATAGAATLAGVDGTLAYTAAGGEHNAVFFTETGPGTVRVENHDNDTITPSGTCSRNPADPSTFVCTGITAITADGGDGIDRLGVSATAIPAALRGGSETDVLIGGDRDDRLDGGPDSDTLDGDAGDDTIAGDGGDDWLAGDRGNDTLDGGGGDDEVQGSSGTDLVVGGSGFDSTTYDAGDISVTLDGLFNDGAPGENDNVDVEDVAAAFFFGFPDATWGNVTLTGDDRPNRLAVLFGPATITGGGGSDVLIGGFHDDTINARDGHADRLTCGGGNDIAVVDSLDVVSDTCEFIRPLDVGNAYEDHPPAVAFTSPWADNARIVTSRPTTLTATASDDRGVAKVQFLADERIVCEDTTAPYTCDYLPRGEDVGRNTLSVMAVDTSRQTATAFRTTRIGRFAARRVTLRVSPRRDRNRPFRFRASGQLQLPAGVSPAQGCRGAVAVQVKAGRNTISTRRAPVRSSCRYSLRVTFDDRGRLPRTGILRFQARYSGNTVLTRRSSGRVRARTK